MKAYTEQKVQNGRSQRQRNKPDGSVIRLFKLLLEPLINLNLDCKEKHLIMKQPQCPWYL